MEGGSYGNNQKIKKVSRLRLYFRRGRGPTKPSSGTARDAAPLRFILFIWI